MSDSFLITSLKEVSYADLAPQLAIVVNVKCSKRSKCKSETCSILRDSDEYKRMWHSALAPVALQSCVLYSRTSVRSDYLERKVMCGAL